MSLLTALYSISYLGFIRYSIYYNNKYIFFYILRYILCLER